MTHFTGAHAGRLDSKGRILVPKSFRDVLQSLVPPGSPSLRLRASDKGPAIEGWPIPEFNAYSARMLEKLDDADAEDFNVIFHWTSLEIEPDGDGRLRLPANFVAHAGLSGDVMFLGSGHIFEIRSREAAVERLAAAAAKRQAIAPPLVMMGEA